MKKFLLICLLSPILCLSQSIFNDFDSFLQDHAVFGAVDYSSIKNNPTGLNNMVEKIASHSLEDVSEDYRAAFYINAYNILVIHQVVQHYPVRSPMDIEGFFKLNAFNVSGENITLDQIEFEKLLKNNIDPRIHFALACAAKGCPYLYEAAFKPEILDEQLNYRARQITKLSSYVFVDDKQELVQVSKIFDWYQDQFLTVSESLIGYINLYRKDKIGSNYKLEFREYDWTLNDR